jgi:hypothetical protein
MASGATSHSRGGCGSRGGPKRKVCQWAQAPITLKDFQIRTARFSATAAGSEADGFETPPARTGGCLARAKRCAENI